MKSIMTLAVLAVFGISTLVFAGWGDGYGHMMEPGMMGPGWQQGGGYYGNLAADEIAKLDQQRSEFFKTTEGIRQQLYDKELALQGELSKDTPDISKASTLQSEISKLRGELDQKRLDYEMQARKSVPNYNRGYRSHGPMMGSGPRGGGYCMW
ncbi:MAG: periplasmic heavy metal sensor [Desulfatirhabdiaceae bacterium]